MLNPNKRGWFTTENRLGDRTIEQQMTGLEQLVSECAGKTIIDAGCAEGLISFELIRHGATSSVGLEAVKRHVALAAEFGIGKPFTVHRADLNEFDIDSLEQADIVLMLAVLHKLHDPTAVCKALAGRARDLVVIRLPPYGTTIVDERSNNVPHDIRAAMASAGFDLERVTEGPLTEWLGYFRRRKTVRDIVEPVNQATEASDAVEITEAVQRRRRPHRPLDDKPE